MITPSILPILGASVVFGGPTEPPPEPTAESTRLCDNSFLCFRTLKFVLNFLRREKSKIKDCNFFNFIIDVLGRRETIDLALASCPLDALGDRTRSHLEAGHSAPENLLMEFWNDPGAQAILKPPLLAALEKKLPRLAQQAASDATEDVLYKRFGEMVQFFCLTEHEADLLLIAYVRHADIWNWMDFSGPQRGGSRFERVRLMCMALGAPLAVGGKFLLKNSRLRTLGCLDSDLEFNTELEPFLTGLTEEPLASKYFARHTDPALPWAMYGKLTQGHGAMLKELIRRRDPDRGLNLLFYGVPGGGKTSFAVSLAAELGMDLYRIRVPEDYDGEIGSSRFAALQVCDRQVNRGRSIILIDEADEMLAGSAGSVANLLGEYPEDGGGKKDTLNTVLDQVNATCIWITNSLPERLTPSSRRRFDYSIEFKPLSHQQRCQVWKNLRRQYQLENIIDDAMVEQLARQFPVSAGGVDLALRNYARLNGDPSASKSAAMDTLQRLLTPHCQLLGIDLTATVSNAADHYALAGLNIRGPVSPQNFLAAVQKFRRNQELPGFTTDTTGQDIRRLTALLFGPSGTGKTQFVKFLGREVDCPVRTCMAGDLLSRYVGGTEQNIREAFRTAAADRAILFIDEADGLFHSRQLAQRSWEVTQVNELLHAMENFGGVMVCATNLMETLDAATIRRFTFKLQFDYLDAAGKLAFYQRVLSELCQEPMNEPAKRRLTSIADLTPGDFATVRQAMYYLSSSDGNSVTHAELLSALEQETEAKRQGKSGNFGFVRD